MSCPASLHSCDGVIGRRRRGCWHATTCLATEATQAASRRGGPWMRKRRRGRRHGPHGAKDVTVRNVVVVVAVLFLTAVDAMGVWFFLDS